jgi:hypothetical protein
MWTMLLIGVGCLFLASEAAPLLTLAVPPGYDYGSEFFRISLKKSLKY